jgi:DNA processing protein
MHSPQQNFDLITLLRSKNINIVEIIDLIRQGNCPSQILQEVKKFKSSQIISANLIEDELDKASKFNAKIITIFSDNYPKLLTHINNPPPILTIKGDINILNEKIIAVVGSRNASYNSLLFAKKIAHELSLSNIVTISGLARGIDSQIHKSSINYKTIAVIAGGINNIYPRQNKYLYELISENGLIISENIFDSAPLPRNFILRNRIISGMAIATIIIEAGIKSGTLSTANFANDQGRYVFAVPGAPYDYRSQGCNKLIKEGAIMMEDIQDVYNEIGPLNSLECYNNEKKLDLSNLEINQRQLLKNIGYSGTPINYLISKFNISSAKINEIISELELKNYIIVKDNKLFLIK